MNVIGSIVRFVVSALVLMFLGLIVPGLSTLNFPQAVVAALVIAALGVIIEQVLGHRLSPYTRGITGFLASAFVIYLAQFFVPGMRVGVLGALIASLLVGVIDLFVPTTIRSTPFVPDKRVHQ